MFQVLATSCVQSPESRSECVHLECAVLLAGRLVAKVTGARRELEIERREVIGQGKWSNSDFIEGKVIKGKVIKGKVIKGKVIKGKVIKGKVNKGKITKQLYGESNDKIPGLVAGISVQSSTLRSSRLY